MALAWGRVFPKLLLRLEFAGHMAAVLLVNTLRRKRNVDIIARRLACAAASRA